ncbi:MAG TPA: hypothetical protein VI699_04500 [Candidatus Acidoferrales bacterium]|nr:hypothetical protein [Candidatus Acidoferrales bacterium]
MKVRDVLVAMLIGVTLLVTPGASPAGTLSTDIIGMFPKDVGEFAYADLKKARQFKWFAQLKEQMLPSRFRQFEQFLASAGIDPNTQVEELAWAFVANKVKTGEGADAGVPTGDQMVGIALGSFSPNSAEEYFKAQKLPLSKVRGYTLFAFGSGVGPNDLFFFFVDSNTAAFGHKNVLEKLIEVRFGAEEGLLRNDKFYPLISEANGRGVVWAVLNSAYTRLAMQQMIPEAQQFPQAAQLLNKIQAMVINVEAGSGLDGRFQAICSTPEDANMFAALLQAGFTYRGYQEQQTNPELARMLNDVRITPRGDRLELRMALTDEQMTSLIRRNTFQVKM